jgi:hypothetical protein
LKLTGKLIGMQYFDEIARGFACGRGSAEAFAAFLHALLVAQGDHAELIQSGGAFEIRQQTWKLMDDVDGHHPACANVLLGLVEGLAAACGRRIGVTMTASAAGFAPFVWTIG